MEFGNARSYYQDYVKFMLARENADVVREREREPVYSGMMSYEKAARELPYLGFMFEMPIVVAGVGVRGS